MLGLSTSTVAPHNSVHLWVTCLAGADLSLLDDSLANSEGETDSKYADLAPDTSLLDYLKDKNEEPPRTEFWLIM